MLTDASQNASSTLTSASFSSRSRFSLALRTRSSAFFLASSGLSLGPESAEDYEQNREITHTFNCHDITVCLASCTRSFALEGSAVVTAGTNPHL